MNDKSTRVIRPNRSWDIQVSVTILSSGQVRPYADSIYTYEIESNLGDEQTKRLCTTFIRRSTNEKPGGRYDGGSGFPFGLESFFKFAKIKDGEYRYTVCEPYTG